MNQSSFGRALRTLRLKQNLSLSAVARSLGVSVVYYRDVERGSRRAFSSVNVDFGTLATVLGTDSRELQQLAALERGQLELDLRQADKGVQKLAVLFADCIAKRRILKAQLRQLHAILERVS